MAILLAVAGLVSLAVTILAGNLGNADSLGSVISAVCMLLSVITGALTFQGTVAEVSNPDEVDLATRALGHAVRNQWLAEARRRGVLNQATADVVWRSVRGDVSIERSSGLTDAEYRHHALTTYRQSRDEQLVVLGPAGIGKSTFAIMLLLALLDHKDDCARVPVYLRACW